MSPVESMALILSMVILVPVVIGIVVVIFLVRSVRELMWGMVLSSQGLTADGRVLDSIERSYRVNGSRRWYRVETIGFVTADGQAIRDSPATSDIGMTDRTGQTVAVRYDRDRPERFIAPQDGRAVSPLKPALKVAICAVILVFLIGCSATGVTFVSAML